MNGKQTEKKYKEVYANGAIRLDYGSEAEKKDLDIIYNLPAEKRPEEEMMKLTKKDLNLTVIDPSLVLRLIKETIAKEPHIESNKPAYGDMPPQGFLAEPVYIDGYKFQMNFIMCMGYFEEVLIDVRYQTGNGYADYNQLSDLIDQGLATLEQQQLWQAIQTIQAHIKDDFFLPFLWISLDIRLINNNFMQITDIVKGIYANSG